MTHLLRLILSLLLLILLTSHSQAQNQDLITRISLTNDGSESNGRSYVTSIDAKGENVVFSSDATNYVEGDSYDTSHIYVHNRPKAYTKRISIGYDGTEGNGGSGGGRISANGRYVAFISRATNLVVDDTNSHSDIFVYDLETSTTKRVSVASDGSQANHFSDSLNISGNGRLIVFTSLASNLVENDNNDALDVFIHDQQTAQTRIVSVTPKGTSGNDYSYNPVISADGRFIAFASSADDLACCPSAFHDIFVRDMKTAQTRHISKAYDGGQTDDSSDARGISADGRYILFSSLASNLVQNDSNDYCAVGGSPNPSCRDLFVYDQKEEVLKHVTVASDGIQANDESYGTTISPNGRYVAFWSEANNLSVHDQNPGRDLFVHDLTTSQTKLVTIGYDGSQVMSRDFSGTPAFSADGTLLSFSSPATNLVPNDTNGEIDAFISRWQEVQKVYRLHLPLMTSES